MVKCHSDKVHLSKVFKPLSETQFIVGRMFGFYCRETDSAKRIHNYKMFKLVNEVGL